MGNSNNSKVEESYESEYNLNSLPNEMLGEIVDYLPNIWDLRFVNSRWHQFILSQIKRVQIYIIKDQFLYSMFWEANYYADKFTRQLTNVYELSITGNTYLDSKIIKSLRCLKILRLHGDAFITYDYDHLNEYIMDNIKVLIFDHLWSFFDAHAQLFPNIEYLGYVHGRTPPIKEYSILFEHQNYVFRRIRSQQEYTLSNSLLELPIVWFRTNK